MGRKLLRGLGWPGPATPSMQLRRHRDWGSRALAARRGTVFVSPFFLFTLVSSYHNGLPLLKGNLTFVLGEG